MALQDDAIEPAPPRNAEYEQLLAVKRDTAHAGAALVRQEEVVDDLKAQLHDCDCSLVQLDANCKSKMEAHKRHRDSNVLRLMYRVTGNKDKLDKMVNKGKQEYESIYQKRQDEQNRNANLRAQVNDAIQVRDELQSLSLIHDRAKSRMDYIGLGFVPINAGDGVEPGVNTIEAFSTVDAFLEQLQSREECPTEELRELDKHSRSL